MEITSFPLCFVVVVFYAICYSLLFNDNKSKNNIIYYIQRGNKGKCNEVRIKFEYLSLCFSSSLIIACVFFLRFVYLGDEVLHYLLFSYCLVFQFS